jgi:hypothetical protein
MSAISRASLPLFISVALMCGAAGAIEDLDHNKSGAKLFADNCANCHRNPRGLAKDQSGWALSDFLRQHYTSSPAAAQTLTAYLQSLAAPRVKAQPVAAPVETPKTVSDLLSWASKFLHAPGTGSTARKPRPKQSNAPVPLPPPRPVLTPERTSGSDETHAPIAPVPD